MEAKSDFGLCNKISGDKNVTIEEIAGLLVGGRQSITIIENVIGMPDKPAANLDVASPYAAILMEVWNFLTMGMNLPQWEIPDNSMISRSVQ